MPKATTRPTMLGALFAELSGFFDRSAETVTCADLKRELTPILANLKEMMTMNAEIQTIVANLTTNLAAERDLSLAIKAELQARGDATRDALARLEASGVTPEQLQELRDLDAAWDASRDDLAAAIVQGTVPAPAPDPAAPSEQPIV